MASFVTEVLFHWTSSWPPPTHTMTHLCLMCELCHQYIELTPSYILLLSLQVGGKFSSVMDLQGSVAAKLTE